MYTIQNYVMPKSIEEAYKVLHMKKNNTLLGGCGFLRMGKKSIGTAIDLSKLKLDDITEDESTIEIGGMTSLRAIETSPILLKCFDGILPESVKNIVGIQFRNTALVGATVYSRYGFSDLNTALLSLETEVELHRTGRMPLEVFLEKGASKDILTKIRISKQERKASFQMLRNSAGDYALLNIAVSREGQHWKIAVGARPGRAILAEKASTYLSESQLTEEDFEKAAVLASEELSFGTNMRASGEYRKAICKVLVRRGIEGAMA